MVVGGEFSPLLPVISGVPQGSVLGPLQFHIYINDIAKLASSSGTFLNLFADDMLLYRYIDSLEDVVFLQQDNDVLNSWLCRNHLTLNPSKCKYMTES